MNLQTIFYNLFEYVWTLYKTQFTTVNFEEFRSKITSLISEIKMKEHVVEKDNLNSALFAACAWIDELVQKSNWMGVRQWQDKLLQAEYFNTTAAGEEFFTRLSKIPSKEEDLIRIYYRCLVLGFEGIYHKPIDKPDLLKYKKYALDQLSHEFNMANYPAEFVAFPLAYKNDELQVIPPKLDQYRTFLWWLLPIPVVLLIYLFFYFVINNTVTNYLHLIK
ncbi:DotU family type IV/VI secretion system protein [Fluoribacter dumoffii]|uniref:DotU family type IV/VI secretion system protein n=1 Tax=Fluoribacter dumoffii TaxID=463 RepID=UPI002243DB40|nr:DotU family type IV/VI secretion system protein [Fluoribacter dumoffii]MCW8416759.1 DotU family type IV/VI secretion system protein [Fluoribacter dumoffii]MCW8455401.1 DotU family type IV/VI secretion system protein [Fluoribacter dumoffii]MCW8460521.1 DotU family type IV/VI secretion system protein [Fluoribacter dumoffii]MCW8484002.1 DotU family type IV/VI secretion system protein [Fluoribacter dumoffii]